MEPKIKEISIAPRMTSTMPMLFNNQPINRIKKIDTFNPKNNYYRCSKYSNLMNNYRSRTLKNLTKIGKNKAKKDKQI